MLNNVALGISLLAKHLGVELANLSEIEKPEGRIDYLVSKLVESGVRSLSPEAQMTYHAARPLIDGFLLAKLGQVQVRIPDEVKALVRRNIERDREEAA